MNFDFLDPTSIISDRPNRQRRELTNIEELAESIRIVGLLNPIIIDRELNLIAGERRLSACLSIGINPIPVQYLDELDPHTRHLVELEENVKRVDLPWIDHVRAVEAYDKLRREHDPEWNNEKTAKALGIPATTASTYLTVAENLENDLVKNADKFSVALNASRRINERKTASVKRDAFAGIDRILGGTKVEETPDGEPGAASEPAAPQSTSILNASFLDWAPNYDGEPFNLIHCDFPYGVGVGDKSGQSAAKHSGHYDDSPEIYAALLNCFINNIDRFASPSAHLIFWFSMDFYSLTKEALEKAGWRIGPFPLIWGKSDNAGILPDSNRGPRRNYETAFFGSRGDRKVVQAVSNIYWGPTTRELHTSEKPRAMLHHFFRMVCDEHSRVFDPTAGSGNAIRVGYEKGADFSLGLELNPEFYETALGNVARSGDGYE